MKKFKRIFIEISNVCNLACSFCPPSKRDSKVMSVQNFETVLSRIEGHGDHIYLHVKGEPLFHKQFNEILALCSQYNKKVNITTNGTLLDKHGKLILETPSVRLVNISLQSYEDIDHEENYKAYLNKIINFVKSGLKDTNKLFELRLWNFNEEHSPSNTSKFTTLEYIRKHLGVTIPITAQNTKGLKGRSNVYISKGHEFEWPSMDNDFVSTSGTCYGLRHQIGILSTGEVVPCCLDADGIISLGNVLESEFESIVTSDRATQISTGFQNRKNC